MSLEDSIFSRGDGLFSIVPVDGPDDPEVQAVQCTAECYSVQQEFTVCRLQINLSLIGHGAPMWLSPPAA